MLPRNAEYLMHRDCGRLAYVYHGQITKGELIHAAYAQYPDGASPKPLDEMMCVSCDKTITQRDLVLHDPWD